MDTDCASVWPVSYRPPASERLEHNGVEYVRADVANERIEALKLIIERLGGQT